MTQVHQFNVPVRKEQLPELFSATGTFEKYDTGVTADLGPFLDQVEDLRSKKIDHASWDREVVGLLHFALRSLSRRLALDMRIWHWLSTVALSEFVWDRWYGSIPTEPGQVVFNDALSGHFLGARTLNGISRNAIARLWWCGETLYSAEDEYGLAVRAFQNQDLFNSVYERVFSLHPPAAKACFKLLNGVGELKHRHVTRVLNHYFATISVEALSEEDVGVLITEILDDYE